MKSPTTRNYLNNKDILLEIHRSKSSYCRFTDPEYHQYDIILPSTDKINIRTIADAKRNKAKRLSDLDYNARKAAGEKIKQSDCEHDYTKISKKEIIFRIMTYDHIPLNNHRKKNPKTEADKHDKVNFPPFQHWKFNDNDELECVGKSHWIGDVTQGEFNPTSGNISNNLAKMMMTLCQEYSTRWNVRGYTYNDEMRDQAILQLTIVGLQFDESKSNNPFAYFTSVVINSICRVINIEKRNQNIRDDILEMNGLNPSYTRTNSGEYESEVKNSDDYY